MMSGKRANIFGQGKPEQPYDERDEPADVPQRATAAQLAARKIKTAKVRRPAGASSTTTPSANFGAPQGFSFGASAPAVGDNSNGMSFGAGSNAFGGGANNSFPPAQSSAPSNSFVSSSFPAFGASTQSTGFNPQPPSANFNFTAGSANPFAQTNGATPATSTPSTNTLGGGSIFGTQAPSNPFGGLAQTNTTSAGGSAGLFGTTSGAPSSNMFGTTNFASNASGTPAPGSTPFTFGATSSAAPINTSTPATSGLFSGFGASTQTAAPPAQTGIFSGFGSNTQKDSAPTASTTQPSLFSTGTSAQGTASATSTAPASNLFSFGTNASKSDNATSAAPSPSLFAASGSTTPTSMPASNPFASLPTAPSSTPAPAFNFGQQTPKAQENASSNPFGAIKLPAASAETPKPSLFSSVKAPQQATPAASETPKPNLFSSLAKPPQPAASTPTFSFGATQNKDVTATTSDEILNASAPEAPKPSLFSGFSTPQPAKTLEADKPQSGLFSAQPKSSSGIFSQNFQPENHNAGNAFKAPTAFPASKPQSTEAPKPAASTEAGNPFAKLPTPSAQTSNLFAPAKEQAPASPQPSMPTLTGGSTSTDNSLGAPELPKIPKAHVPKEWAAASGADAQKNDGLFNLITSLTIQLQRLNEKYRAKLNSLSPSADWASLSLWHHQHSSAIKKKIDIAKKQRAQSKGITGTESALSTKRKVNDESPEDRQASPTKRARPAETIASPTPQPSIPAPKFNPPPTATSNLFAKAINSQPSTSPEPSNLFTPKTTATPASEPSKSAAPITGFRPSVPGAVGAGVASPFSSTGFKPTTSSTSSNTSGGFKPTTTGGSGGFASQFAAKAKTYEELAAERKKKAKDADYDSDDETEEEWSARYDKEEADRIAKEKADAASVSGFSLPPSAKTSGASTPFANLFSSLAKPAGTSTPTNGLFTPRPASPALSTGGQSVFDAPSTAQAGSPNIFGHLSSGPSSNQDHSDDEDEHLVRSAEPTTPPKRRLVDSGTEADEERASKRQDTAPKGSLLSRMTKSADDGSESEKENNGAGSIFGNTNGTTTPTNKPFSFFNFEAAGANTAPAKSDTFGGDQTFKPGTPIKFGDAPATEKKGEKAPPIFQFQPATASTTPSKPPPTSLFNFGSTTSGSSLLTPGAGLSALNSAPSSVFSSRAATPLSEAETSAQSAAEDEEEGGKQEQVDLSKLTEEELASNDIVFEAEKALAKHQVDKGDGTKVWEPFAKGPLWILKDKVTGKCFVRIRIASGATPLNYNILPALKTQILGNSGKMVSASMPKKEGGIAQVLISVQKPEIAKEFSTKYNASVPS